MGTLDDVVWLGLREKHEPIPPRRRFLAAGLPVAVATFLGAHYMGYTEPLTLPEEPKTEVHEDHNVYGGGREL